MKGNIRNRKVVALAMTQTRLSGKNPDADFTKKVGSRALFYKDNELTVKDSNRKTPNAKFSKVDVGGGAFIWAPTNVAGQNYIAALSEEERDAFLYHAAPPREATKPESHRVVDGRPIKGLPNGHREGDYYDAVTGACIKDTPKRPKVARTNDRYEPGEGPTNEPVPAYIDDIRAQISAGTFK